MGKIWRKVSGEELQTPAERVLSRCKKHDSVDCWSSPIGALQMAVYLQQHSENGATPVATEAKVRVAYRSFHPEPVRFTRTVECLGGTIEDYDPDLTLEIMAGRNGARRYRTGVVPDAVTVQRGSEGTQVDARIAFAQTRLQLDNDGVAEFAVIFPDGEDPQCSCC